MHVSPMERRKAFIVSWDFSHIVCVGCDQLASQSAEEVNQSLTILAECINLVAIQIEHSRIPFNKCRLTEILEDSLAEDAKICVFVNVSPDPSKIKESIQTLQYAAKFNHLTNGRTFE